mmetsp:Transcript_4049/g.7097  ORF Transcript_4049/g.7097 Transcript_4049/m.7097 type:complete len:414 (+) Transcript_4049:2144-3385(+)
MMMRKVCVCVCIVLLFYSIVGGQDDEIGSEKDRSGLGTEDTTKFELELKKDSDKPVFVLVPETGAGIGNQIQHLWNLLALASIIKVDIVIPPIGWLRNVHRSHKITDSAQSYYDLDRLAEFVNVRHFESTCKCFDAGIYAKSARSEEESGQRITHRPPYEPHLWENSTKVYVDDRVKSGVDALSTWRNVMHDVRNKPSRCSNENRCVVLGYNTHLDLSKSYPALPEFGKRRREIMKALLPSTFLRSLVGGYLPGGVSSLNTTLVVHLRYFAGEYRTGNTLCFNGKYVCIGRGSLKDNSLKKIDIEEFGERILSFAKSINCTQVFPIMPPFCDVDVQKAVCNVLGVDYASIISQRSISAVSAVIIERTLATVAKAFTAETVGTTFSTTINVQRKSLGLPLVYPLEDILLNQTTK